MQMSSEFEIEITEDLEPNLQQPVHPMDTDINNSYIAIPLEQSASWENIIQLQSLLKSERLLLEYQQKRKVERVKQIEFAFVNVFSHMLKTRALTKESNSYIILNTKDLISIEDNLAQDLEILQKVLFNVTDVSVMRPEIKPNASFFVDFMNFYPNWRSLVSSTIALEVNNCDKVEDTFESEYTFASKVLNHLRLNNKVSQFCANIFELPLIELSTIEEELIVDFTVIYEKWSQSVFNKIGLLNDFLLGKVTSVDGVNIKKIRAEIQVFYGRLRNDEEVMVLTEEMSYFQKKQQAISFLLAEVGSEEISTDTLNLKLAWLVWKRVLANRKKLEFVSSLLVSQIVNNYERFPVEIKFVVREFRRACKLKFGEMKFEDLKTFFNKVIFSQLLFSEFMNLHGLAGRDMHRDFNITMIALVSQKIMFGQQFYEKFKYGSFNQVIHHFSDQIKHFILRFANQDVINSPPQPQVECALLSLQTVKYLYNNFREGSLLARSEAIENCFKKTHHQIGDSAYALSNIYVVLSKKPQNDYNLVLQPADTIKKAFIQFMLLIDKVPDRSSIKSLLEQYKCNEEEGFTSRPSIQLYANYLLLAMKQNQVQGLLDSIHSDISKCKSEVQKTKICLQKEFNYTNNICRMLGNCYEKAEKIKNQQEAKQFLDRCDKIALDFDYNVLEKRICEGQVQPGKEKTVKKCLIDVCQYFSQSFQGTDGLFHLLMQKIVDQLKKTNNSTFSNEKIISVVKHRVGQKLYKMLSLQNHMNSKDQQLQKAIQRHKFVTLKMLELHAYAEEEELLVSEAVSLLKQLNDPHSADELLNILHEVTLVFQNIILTTGKASDITADVQIPLMILVVLRSGVCNLISICEFIEQLCIEDISSSILGQTLTLVKSAIFLITTLDAQKLNITPQEYEQHLAPN